jgi:uroporphyrinogen decarboxylase
MPLFLEHPVKEVPDWEKIKKERLNPNSPGRVAEDWDAFRARIKETGESVQVGSFPWGIFGTPRDFMGAEELLMAFYTEPDMIRDMMDTMTTLWISNWEQVAREVQIDHIHIWEDMSGRQGSLLSPEMVEDFMMPCYDRIVDFARANGVRIISVDTDGDCSELVPIMMKHGINMFFPFETQASNDIIYFRDNYPDLGIMCGLDKRALAADKAAVDKEIEKCELMIKRGRYIPGFDHLIPPDAKWENFRYAAEEIKALCYR